MKNFEELNRVTMLSRVLAAVVFIALPFIGFLVGLKYQGELSTLGGACPTSLVETVGNAR